MGYNVNLATSYKEDSSNANDSYSITDAGVLQLIKVSNDGEHIVTVEYAPHAWTSVTGTRFVGSTDSLAGSDRKIVNGELF